MRGKFSNGGGSIDSGEAVNNSIMGTNFSSGPNTTGTRFFNPNSTSPNPNAQANESRFMQNMAATRAKFGVNKQ